MLSVDSSNFIFGTYVTIRAKVTLSALKKARDHVHKTSKVFIKKKKRKREKEGTHLPCFLVTLPLKSASLASSSFLKLLITSINSALFQLLPVKLVSFEFYFK